MTTSSLPARQQVSIGPAPFKIPGAPRPTATSMDKSLIWIYGAIGVGKTYLANTFPGTWFLATERGQDWIETREPTIIHDWKHFLSILAGIESARPKTFEDGHLISHLCIDTVDILFQQCSDYVCDELNIEHPSELDRGKGWNRLNMEFARAIQRMRRWPYGLLCISHEKMETIEIRGKKQTKYGPDIGAAGMRTLSALSDFTFRAFMHDYPSRDNKGELTGKFEEQRLLQCQPSTDVTAKARPTKPAMPKFLPMNYAAIIAAITPPSAPTTTKG